MTRGPRGWAMRLARIVAGVFELFYLGYLIVHCLFIRWLARHRRSTERPRLFIGTMHINSLPMLAEALRERGFEATMLVRNSPAHEAGRVRYDIDLRARFPFIHRVLPLRYLMELAVFPWAAARFDVFLMPFRNRMMDNFALLGRFELPLLHLAKRHVVLNSYGADVMTPRLTPPRTSGVSVLEGYRADDPSGSIDERAIAANSRHCEAHADFIVSSIDHVDYLRRVDEYLHLRCIDASKLTPRFEVSNSVPVILHAPNHRTLKGTRYLEAAVASLQRQGVPCRLEILEGRPNAEVLERVAASDIVADQFLIGAYARFAIEAMALGKPVLCYLREDLIPFNPIWRDCPIVNADPARLEEKLARLLAMSADARAELGKRGRAYVERYHSMEYVGGRFAAILRSVVDAELPRAAADSKDPAASLSRSRG